jgi:hypothetical protein
MKVEEEEDCGKLHILSSLKEIENIFSKTNRVVKLKI